MIWTWLRIFFLICLSSTICNAGKRDYSQLTPEPSGLEFFSNLDDDVLCKILSWLDDSEIFEMRTFNKSFWQHFLPWTRGMQALGLLIKYPNGKYIHLRNSLKEQDIHELNWLWNSENHGYTYDKKVNALFNIFSMEVDRLHIRPMTLGKQGSVRRAFLFLLLHQQIFKVYLSTYKYTLSVFLKRYAINIALHATLNRLDFGENFDNTFIVEENSIRQQRSLDDIVRIFMDRFNLERLDSENLMTQEHRLIDSLKSIKLSIRQMKIELQNKVDRFFAVEYDLQLNESQISRDLYVNLIQNKVKVFVLICLNKYLFFDSTGKFDGLFGELEELNWIEFDSSLFLHWFQYKNEVLSSCGLSQTGFLEKPFQFVDITIANITAKSMKETKHL